MFDPRILAWMDAGAMREVRRYLPDPAAWTKEAVVVSYPDPQHAELVATIEAPGIVVLSDVDYPGWELTIDGRPAPIYRVNIAMRGAAVEKGTHKLVYSYRPRSFRIGVIASLAGLAGLVLLAAACAFRPVVGGIAEAGSPPSGDGPPGGLEKSAEVA
jgi:hypothetical protein